MLGVSELSKRRHCANIIPSMSLQVSEYILRQRSDCSMYRRSYNHVASSLVQNYFHVFISYLISLLHMFFRRIVFLPTYSFFDGAVYLFFIVPACVNLYCLLILDFIAFRVICRIIYKLPF